MLKTVACRLCFNFSRQFYVKVKPSIQPRSMREVSIRGENGLCSLKKLLYFPLLVCVSLFFLSLIQESVSCSIMDEFLDGRFMI